MLDSFFEHQKLRFCLDTYHMARTEIPKDGRVRVPSAFNLETTYQFITGSAPINAHRAYADVKATISILRYEIVWRSRKEHFFQVLRREDHPSTSYDN